MSAELLTHRPAGSDTTLVLKLSNPGARNALHPDMYAAGIEALSTAERDNSVRAIVLTGADNFFCAGGNLNRLLENRAKDPSVQAESIDLLAEWISALRASTKPVIAAVEGAAAGAGFSLALACDLIVAADDAKFVMSYARVGLTPDGGASWFLTRVAAHARERGAARSEADRRVASARSRRREPADEERHRAGCRYRVGRRSRQRVAQGARAHQVADECGGRAAARRASRYGARRFRGCASSRGRARRHHRVPRKAPAELSLKSWLTTTCRSGGASS